MTARQQLLEAGVIDPLATHLGTASPLDQREILDVLYCLLHVGAAPAMALPHSPETAAAAAAARRFVAEGGVPRVAAAMRMVDAELKGVRPRSQMSGPSHNKTSQVRLQHSLPVSPVSPQGRCGRFNARWYCS